ncbi:MAG: hypothetical protein DMF03_10550 [Verrucomicrobia bacterium]|nr:MAG: hypothetical protein DMF03_10550 [Verrucomicrobiota bacterium]
MEVESNCLSPRIGVGVGVALGVTETVGTGVDVGCGAGVVEGVGSAALVRGCGGVARWVLARSRHCPTKKPTIASAIPIPASIWVSRR